MFPVIRCWTNSCGWFVNSTDTIITLSPLTANIFFLVAAELFPLIREAESKDIYIGVTVGFFIGEFWLHSISSKFNLNCNLSPVNDSWL